MQQENNKSDLSLILRTKLLTLNEYIKIERAHRLAAAQEKKKLTNAIALECLDQTRVRFERKIECKLIFHTSKRVDDDNLFFGAKFILDGMSKAGIIKTDGPKWVSLKSERFQSNKDYVQVVCKMI